MIIRRDQAPEERVDAAAGERVEQLQYSDAGGLTQFGAYVEVLRPEAVSSHRHYHEEEDEFLYVLSGEATVVENDGEHPLRPGDAACWPAGEANAHQVVNRSDAPCSYLIFGIRMARDIIHYPDGGRILYIKDGSWRLESTEDGTLINEGKDEKVCPMTWRKPRTEESP